MRWGWMIVAMAWLAAAPVMAQELKKLSLDDAAAVALKIETDTAVKTEGQASVRITTPGPVTVCLAEVNGLAMQGGKLVYSARVRSALEGSAYLEMWVSVAGGQFFSRGQDFPIEGKSEWKLLQTPFLFKSGQKPGKVILNLVITGKGTVWVDDITLSKER